MLQHVEIIDSIRQIVQQELDARLHPTTHPNFQNIVLNQTEAAQYLHKKPRTLEKWRCTGDGPPFTKAGGRVLYRQDDLDAWLASRVRRSTSDPGIAVTGGATG